MMIGVITGNIKNSRKYDAQLWLPALKHTLSIYGTEPENWEIFRGDNFQLEVSRPEGSLLAAIHLKAAIKQLIGPDVRMSIGIGDNGYKTGKISENNGTAYIYSGKGLENLKQTMIIKTPWADFDKEINIYLSLALIVMDGWTPGAAKTVNTIFESRAPLSQAEIGKKLGIKQSGTSQRLTRAHYKEIMDFEDLFCAKVKKLSDTLIA
jgi:hypothetical protein